MAKNKKIITLIILIVLTILSTISNAENMNNTKKVYMIVADKLTLEDIDNMDNLKAIRLKAGYGLLNTKGANNANSSEGFLSINASSRAYGESTYASAFNLEEKKLSLYKKRVGFVEAGKYQVGNTEINRILEDNLNQSYDAKIGSLGDNIHKAGLKTAIFGNSDTDELFFRMASLIAMDSKGLVDYGNVDNILVKDDNYPYGLKTDYNKVINEIEKIKKDTSLVVIDTGDLKRLDLYNSYLNEETFSHHRNNILKEMDRFIGELIKNVDGETMFIVLSPTIENQRLNTSKLAPILIWDTNISEKSVISSGTTRRTGIVSNLDIAPTITEFLNVSNDNFVGNKITFDKNDRNVEYVNKLDKNTNLISNLRSPYLKIYNILTILFIILATMIVVLNKDNSKRNINMIEKGLLTIIAVPITLLILPLLNISNTYIYIFSSIMILILIVALTSVIFKKKNRIWALLILNVLIILIDISTDSNLTKNSIIGYDPIIGARYFGIGNELVGVLIASLLTVVSFLSNRLNNKIPMILLPIAIIIVGHPNLGANVGGTISLLFASIIFISLISNFKLNIKRLFMIFITIALTILTIGVIDIYINPNPTHLGQTILMILRDGPISITSVLIRKISINIKLIGKSTWAKVLYTSIITGFIIIKRYQVEIRDILNRNKYLDIGFISVISGSIIGFLVNDSGLLLAAISITFIIVILINLIVISSHREN